MRKIIALIAALTTLLLITGGLAVADNHQGAQNKDGDYNSQGESVAGIFAPLSEIILLFGATSEAETDKEEPAHAESSAGQVILFGEALPIFGVNCAATGDPDEGVDRDQQEASLIDEQFGDSSLTLLRAYCDARAVKHNNAMASSENTVLAADLEGELGATVLHSESETKTTSGQARSSSGFTAAEVKAGDETLTVVDCEARSKDTHGTEDDEVDGTLLAGGGESLDDPGLCELFVGSDASHER